MFQALQPAPAFQASGNFFDRLNPAVQAQTADSRWLSENTRRSRLAHELFAREQAERLAEENALLERALSGGVANLFNAPQNEQDARLQQIVQGDVNARQRGENFVWSDPQRLRYQSGLEDLRRQQIQNDLAPRTFGLNQQRFAEQQKKNLYDIINQQTAREQAAARLAAQDRQNDLKNKFAEANFDLRGRQAQMSAKDKEVARKQAKEREEASEMDRLFQSAAKAADTGAVPPSDVRRLFDSLDPQKLEIVEGYARKNAQGVSDFKKFVDANTEQANQKLEAKVSANAPGWLDRIMGKAPTDRSVHAQSIIDELNRNRDLRGRLIYDRATGRIISNVGAAPNVGPGTGTAPAPAPVAPAQPAYPVQTMFNTPLQPPPPAMSPDRPRLAPPPSAAPSPFAGQVVRDRQTGAVSMVGPDGEMTPMSPIRGGQRQPAHAPSPAAQMAPPASPELGLGDYDQQIQAAEGTALQQIANAIAPGRPLAIGPAQRNPATGFAIDDTTGQEIPRLAGEPLMAYELRVARQRLGFGRRSG